jgi:hypothetical protein
MIIIAPISWYYSFKALENRKEEYLDKLFRVMNTPFPFDEKYYTEKGLTYRNKALLTGLIGFIGFIIIVIFDIIKHH